MADRMVRGYCPMGCGPALCLDWHGDVRCGSPKCPRPTAAAELLGDQETDHIVLLGDTGFTVRHPLRERLDDALMACRLHENLAALGGPPQPPGRYRVTGDSPDGWTWTAAPDGPV